MKPMKIFYSRIIPFKGFRAITLFNVIFVRKEYEGTSLKTMCTHESIHQKQAYDFGIGFCGYFIFYIWYLLEWLLKVPSALFGYRPYYSISFEQEAIANDKNPDYPSNRKRFCWIKNVFKLVK